MLETYKSRFQDWSEACEYANECALDPSLLRPTESSVCLLLTAVIALFFWRVNGWRAEERAKLSASASDGITHHLSLRERLSPSLLGDAATASFVSAISALANISGLQFLLFPELGALTSEIVAKPRGVWANSPLMLVVTPFLAGMVGTLATQQAPYGLMSIVFTVTAAILVIRMLGSPITPAISAGLLPLTLGETSWWYAPSLLVGTGLLAGVSMVRQRLFPLSPEPLISDGQPSGLHGSPSAPVSWFPFFAVFMLMIASGASLTGVRFLLFPPLAVIAFEMFAHASACPWAQRPLMLPVVCGLTAAAGVVIVGWLGTGVVAVALTVICGTALLRVLALHVPPAIAVGLLPFVLQHPDHHFSLAVIAGTAMLSITFLLWQGLTAGSADLSS